MSVKSEEEVSNVSITDEEESEEEEPKVGPLAHKVLWSCVARDGVIVVDAAEKDVPFQKAVMKTATDIRELNEGRVKAGFSNCFYKPPRVALKGLKTPPLVGLKLTVLDSGDGDDFDEENADKNAVAAWDAFEKRTVWTFCCVFNPAATSWKHPYPHVDRDVESFLKEIDRISAPNREAKDSSWRTSGWDGLAVQKQFSHILLGAMRDVGYIGKRDRVNQSVDEAKKNMNDNITHMIEKNQVQAEQLLTTSDDLLDQTKVFKKKSKDLKDNQKWKNRKMALILGGTCATVGGAVTIPVAAAFI